MLFIFKRLLQGDPLQDVSLDPVQHIVEPGVILQVSF